MRYKNTINTRELTNTINGVKEVELSPLTHSEHLRFLKALEKFPDAQLKDLREILFPQLLQLDKWDCDLWGKKYMLSEGYDLYYRAGEILRGREING